jgi:hypothetical protein
MGCPDLATRGGRKAAERRAAMSDKRDAWRRAEGINRTAQKLADAAARAEKRLKLRRFIYYRNRHARLDDPRLRLAAKIAGAPLYLVEAFVQRLDMFASANTPRGSLEGLSIEALAEHWTVREELLARLYAALEEPRVGWIDQDYVVDFWSENPDTDDPTANERQDRSRKFRKAFDELARLARIGRITGAERTEKELAIHALRDRVRRHLVSWAEWKTELAAILTTGAARGMSQRDSVTVTTRSDHHITQTPKPVDNLAAGAGGAAPGLSEGQARRAEHDPQAIDPALWLASEGVRIVTERMQETRTLAETRMARWRDRELAGDAAALGEIIRAADAADYMGARFHNLIVDQIKRRAVTADGQKPLPLPPAPVASTKKAVGDD